MFLACSLKSPHASAPTVETEVFINEHISGRKRGDGWTRVETTAHRIALPPPETWTLDTVRAVLTTLRRFLPAHQLTEAHARIDLYGQRPVRHAILAVQARGWEAEAYVPSLRGSRARFDERLDSRAIEFSEPMIAALKDLHAKSPIALASLTPVDVAVETSPTMPVDMNDIINRLPPDKRSALLTILRSTVEHAVEDLNDEDDD